jgi:hypothetical protein
MSTSSRIDTIRVPVEESLTNVSGFGQPPPWNEQGVNDRKVSQMYISGGVLALIIIVLLLIWIF